MNLTIVMYHYVRDFARSRYPGIKGLATDKFKEQLAYIKTFYHPVSAWDVMDAIEGKGKLPPRSILLTFDDGYIDHFTDVFPVLARENISACFFPPAKCILEDAVLDVNKIHFILAEIADKRALVNYIYQALDEQRGPCDLESNDTYWKRCGVASRFDPAEVTFVKSMLQRELPEDLRKTIVDRLFRKYVSTDEKAFARELYMSIDQLRLLQENNMYVGSHGYEHYWLDSVPEATQRREVDLSLEFLKLVGSDTRRWIMCFPWGAYNDSMLSLLRERNCLAGLTTKVGIAEGQVTDIPMILPRLDTNDLPRVSGAKPNEWTTKVLMQ